MFDRLFDLLLAITGFGLLSKTNLNEKMHVSLSSPIQ